MESKKLITTTSLAVNVKTPITTTTTTATTTTTNTTTKIISSTGSAINTSDDPHEQKLYQMFKSYDVDSKDSLDRESLIKLCKTLEIKDQGAHLISYFLNTKPFHRITFDEFKEGLLHYFTDYGMDGNGNCDELNNNHTTDDNLTNQQSTMIRSLSPSREVSPKFIVGTKKYGRRSRPQSVHTFIDSSQSDDTDDNEYDLPNTSSSDDHQTTASSNKVQRSSSHSDIHGTKRRRPIYNTKLKRCASLPAQKPQKNKDDKQLQTQLESSVESLDKSFKNKDSLITTNVIINMWESAGILNATALLKDLGFTGSSKELYLSELLTILDDELRTVQTGTVQTTRLSDNNNSLGDGDDNESSTLLKASLVLHKAEVSRLQESYKQLAEQNRKLQDDNKEANRRASLLAQEVDERHASLENSTRTEIHQLERRHNSIVRNLTIQICADREQLTNLNTKLEAHIKQLEKNELRLKGECERLKNDNNTLEDEQITLQKQVTELLETNIKLNTDIAVIQDHLDVSQYKDEQNLDKDVNELRNTIRLLQLDNSNLRDKNDELSMELEEIHIKCTKLNTIILKSKQINKLIDDASDDIDSGGGGGGGGSAGAGSNNSVTNQNNQLATKRRGDSPSKARISEESPRLGKLRKCNNDDDDNCNNNSGSSANNTSESSTETSGDWITLNSELPEHCSGSSPPNCCSSLSKISQESASITITNDELHKKMINLENELDAAKHDGIQDDDGDSPRLDTNIKKTTIKLEARVKELEQSLDQMRKVYEECEDYWQGKLNEERQLYEEEQRISDEKFKEIVTKMAEYDEQFVVGADRDSGGRLTPIEEKYQLEQQYLEFEAEAEKIKENARELLEEKTLKILQLQEQIHQLKHRLNEHHSNDDHNEDGEEDEDEDEDEKETEEENDDDTKRQSRHKKINNPPPAAAAAATAAVAVNVSEKESFILNQTSPQNITTIQMTMNQNDNNNNNISPASSPISYLWNQSTIQAPARDYQNPNWNNRNFTSQQHSAASSENGFNDQNNYNNNNNNNNNDNNNSHCDDRIIMQQSISPIQRPISPSTKSKNQIIDHQSLLLIRDCAGADISDVSSVRSFGTHSVASTHSVHRSLPDAICSSPNDELKKLKLMEMELHDGIKELIIQRDGLVMELQQLQEAKPVLEKAYARTSHPSLNQRIQQLEQKNRHLRNCLVQQQHYTETILHQTWYQQRSEIGELHSRLEAQGILIAEQVQRLTNADILVKDLYVENSQLSAAIQRLEQQRSRNSILLHQGLGNSISGSTSGLSPI